MGKRLMSGKDAKSKGKNFLTVAIVVSQVLSSGMKKSTNGFM